MSASTTSRQRLAVQVVLPLVVAGQWMLIAQLAQLVDTTRRVDPTDQAGSALQQLDAAMARQLADVRGYTLASDPGLLAASQNNAQVEHDAQRIVELVADQMREVEARLRVERTSRADRVRRRTLIVVSIAGALLTILLSATAVRSLNGLAADYEKTRRRLRDIVKAAGPYTRLAHAVRRRDGRRRREAPRVRCWRASKADAGAFDDAAASPAGSGDAER
jgi:hypothetical protein